ncbi:MAG: three-Cys-motif partner protein TcmP [Pyrinomonadaceae bacterium]
MAIDRFYDEQTAQSEIKTEIVRKYFWAWAKVISKQVRKIGKDKVGYVDLFAGRGTYNDGSKSTPFLILEGAIRDPIIREMLVAYFNDEDPQNCNSLTQEIEKIPLVTDLRNKPLVTNKLVDDEMAEFFEKSTTIPSLFFLDPWGYKGLSLRLVKAVIQSWGCDCMFFFNYNRINGALSNPVMTHNMNKFFGEANAKRLRSEILQKSPEQREKLIIQSVKDALKELGGTYSIEYFFKDANGSKTSHFLIFVSKNILGYDIMKSIMAKESSFKIEGVASFGFNPNDERNRALKESAPTLFEMFESPISTLSQKLIEKFCGQTLTLTEIYQNHHLGTEYILKNYQDALRHLEEQGRINVEPAADKRRKINGIVTFGESVLVTFL